MGCNGSNRLVLVDRKVVGIIIFFMDSILLSVLEGRYVGYFVGTFDGTVDDVGGPCVGLLVLRVMTDY